MSHIVLLGQMGAGKTSVGAEVAARLTRSLIDSDAEVLRETGRDARQIAGEEGVAALHAIEHLVLRRAMSEPVPAVIAAAAGAVDDPQLVSLLQTAMCVWLRADAAVLAARRPTGAHRRPVGASESAKLSARDDQFRRLAALVIDTGSVDIATAASLIEELM